MADNISLKNGNIIISGLTKPVEDINSFIHIVQQWDDTEIPLFFIQDNPTYYPNVTVPIYGLMRYYEDKKRKKFILHNVPEVLNQCGFENAFRISNQGISPYMSRIWQFEDTDQVFHLVSKFKEELYGLDEFGADVLNTIEWCLYEVMDNVLNHSNLNGRTKGWVMGQIHRSTKRLAFCIFDYGIGIYNSLINHPSAPATPKDALTLAIKQGATRDKSLGQGNGLWGLNQLIWENNGQLRLVSHGAIYQLKDQQSEFFQQAYPDQAHGSTCVDFQISYQQPIRMAEVLSIGDNPYYIVNDYLENLEDERGRIVIAIALEPGGYGTRPSGYRLRNKIINLLKEHRGKVILDFTNVSIISSSYADELIGKLVAEWGIVHFANRIEMISVNPVIHGLLTKAVAERLAERITDYPFVPDTDPEL